MRFCEHLAFLCAHLAFFEKDSAHGPASQPRSGRIVGAAAARAHGLSFSVKVLSVHVKMLSALVRNTICFEERRRRFVNFIIL